MPNPAFHRWTEDDIATLKNMAQKHPSSTIAAQLGRSVAATAVKAHELKLSLRLQSQRDQVKTSADPETAGFASVK